MARYNVRDAASRARIALQCVDLLVPDATPEQRTSIAKRILAICDCKVVLSGLGAEERLLDAVYDILQVNLALLKGGTLGHEDHEAYFRQHVAILKQLMGRDKAVEPGGIAQSAACPRCGRKGS